MGEFIYHITRLMPFGLFFVVFVLFLVEGYSISLCWFFVFVLPVSLVSKNDLLDIKRQYSISFEDWLSSPKGCSCECIPGITECHSCLGRHGSFCLLLSSSAPVTLPSLLYCPSIPGQTFLVKAKWLLQRGWSFKVASSYPPCRF